VGFDVLTTCQPSTVWCSRERLPAAATQPAKVRQSCSATDDYYYYIADTYSSGMFLPVGSITADPGGVFGRLDAGIAGSNPAGGMDVCRLCLFVVLSCVGRGLCDGLIPRAEEFYRVSNRIQKPLRKGRRKTSIDILT
jgi:hypothetical protein